MLISSAFPENGYYTMQRSYVIPENRVLLFWVDFFLYFLCVFFVNVKYTDTLPYINFNGFDPTQT